MVGELALDGSVRPVAGVLAIAEAARALGAEAIVVPAENGPEAALVDGHRGDRRSDSLGQLPALAAGEWAPAAPEPLPLRARRRGAAAPDLADLRGQRHLRHALEVAAAGGHSLLMVGPPGAGKSLAASRLPSILPPLAPDEALEVARIASACGRLGEAAPRRPALPRAPPHDQPGGPGRRRQPAAARARRRSPTAACSSSTSSASSAATPWRRCGSRWRAAGSRSPGPAPGSACPAASCSSPRPTPAPAGAARPTRSAAARRSRSQRYQARLSGALADRIDILAAIRQPSAEEIGGAPGEPSAAVRERVAAARERQERPARPGPLQRRDDAGRGARVRARATAPRRCSPTAYARRRLSGRAHDRVLRLARTIADLAGDERIEREQMAQALQLRRRDYE